MFHISDEIWERGKGMTIMMNMLTRIEPEEGMDRWYFVGIQPTLLEPWAVICAWGNRRTRYARMRSLPAESLKVAEEIAAAIVSRKMRRGYLITGSSEDATSAKYTIYKGRTARSSVFKGFPRYMENTGS
jgi:predicted DNA-binding WGR domain protein